MHIVIYVCNQTKLAGEMSHINDLIGVLRGLRLVVEAGTKAQQEMSSVVWNNSSLKPLLTNCPTNTISFNPNPNTTKELVDRALVVAHGFRQFAFLHIPNITTSVVQPQMDQQMKDEIEELNKEFNRTFESLKKVQVETPALFDQPVLSKVEAVAPLEDLQAAHTTQSIPTRIPTPQSIRAEQIVQAVFSPEPTDSKLLSTPPTTSTVSKAKPVAKKKIKVAVSS